MTWVEIFAADLSDGLVGHWSATLQETKTGTNVEDLTAGGAFATMEGAVDWDADTGGNGTHGWIFPTASTANLIQFATSSIAKSVDMSTSLWFKPNASSGVIFCFEDRTVDDRWRLVRDSGSQITASCGSNVTYTFNATTSDGTWHHLALVKQGTDLTLYLDGSALPSQTVAAYTNSTPVIDAELGRLNNLSNPIAGSFDSIRHYSRALTAQEVQDLYDAGRAENFPDSSPVGRWSPNLQATLGNTLTDDIGSNDLTWTGDTGAENADYVFEDGRFHVAGKRGAFEKTDYYSPSVKIDITASMWIRLPASPAMRYDMPFGLTTGSSRGVSLLNDDNTTTLTAYNQESSGQSNNIGTGSSGLYGSWHHVAITAKESTDNVELFIDGVSVGNDDSTDLPEAMLYGALSFGMRRFNDSYDFANTGDYDDLILWERVLTPAEIAQVYADGRPTPNLPQPTGRWSPNFEASPGNTLTDQVGSLDIDWTGDTGFENAEYTWEDGRWHVTGGRPGYFISSGNTGALSENSHTLSIWVKWLDLDRAGQHGFCALSGNSSDYFCLFTPTGDSWWGGFVAANETAFRYNTLDNLTDGQWHHWCYTKLGDDQGETTRTTLYLDGVQVTSSAYTADLSGGDWSKVMMGHFRLFNFTETPNSSYDDMQWFSRALNDDEVNQIYLAGRPMGTQPSPADDTPFFFHAF